jgi:asparagine synthase (glutamine-hydrolysing)
MCGIAGLVDLSGTRPIPEGTLAAMAATLVHRGPDDDGFVELPGLGLASRRLSIVGLADGRQPLFNEDGRVAVVFNGELFDYPELRAELEGRGHRFATRCDTEVLPHLWEEHGEDMLARLRGQFAFALWDAGRRLLVLARDRFGICPLFWTCQGGWLLFASEIKALLASGAVPARPDPHGIDQMFTFLALPGPRTCFQGIQSLFPGHYLRVQLGRAGEPARVTEHTYWEMEFPDWGQEEPGPEPGRLADDLERLLVRAVQRRLRADVPVVSYLSGGVDSSLVTALASRLQREPLPAFTIRIEAPGLDETGPATFAARQIGVAPVIVPCGAARIMGAYPRLIEAAEAPVADTCCAALLLLAGEVHSRGYKVALTGEGADESLAGYPWYRLQKLLGWLDLLPGLPVGQWARRAYLRWLGRPGPAWSDVRRVREVVGGHHAWLDLYGLLSLSRPRLYGPGLRDVLDPVTPFAELSLPLERLRRWHPLHQSLYLGMRVHLPGLLLSSGGDRVAMHSSVETRYPFLDEDLVAFLARLHPRWKLRRFREKYLLRRVAERWLPRSVAWRPKAMFRAPFDLLGDGCAPAFVGQLLSPESLRRTGYFDPDQVAYWRGAVRQLREGSGQRVAMEIGLAGVVATQLWHHTFIEGTLADLPACRPSADVATASRTGPRVCGELKPCPTP